MEKWAVSGQELGELQKRAVEVAKAPLYPFETTVVYNKALDDISENDDIKLIVIGDNPGKDEQLLKNNRYLVGQAGKIAEGYFRRNPELCVDFRKNVIILNKTPIHSGKTAQLKTIAKLGGEKIKNLIDESQLWMAEKTARLHCDLIRACSEDEVKPELWLVGYGELKDRGIFSQYRDCLKNTYFKCSGENRKNDFWKYVYVFQHFSMNRFSIDLNNYSGEGTLQEKIHSLGEMHKNEIFK